MRLDEVGFLTAGCHRPDLGRLANDAYSGDAARVVCFVLVIVIMLQSGSAADLAGAFGGAGSQTAFGPRGAANFLSRATTWCAIVFMMTSLTLSVKRVTSERRQLHPILEDPLHPASKPDKPAAPAAARRR